MTLKAVLFDFNGIIINDEPLHQILIEQLLIEENLRPKPEEYWEICLGRSDRACLKDLLSHRGRVVTEEHLDSLIARKSKAYQDTLKNLDKLPIYPALPDLMFQLRAAKLPMAIVSGALRSEIETVLTRVNLLEYFPIIVSAEDVTASKPEPEGYLLAVERLNAVYPTLNLKPAECMAIEDSYPGIEAAKRAGIPVAGVAHTHPFHMLQRRANWTVDYLNELDLTWIRQRYEPRRPIPTVANRE